MASYSENEGSFVESEWRGGPSVEGEGTIPLPVTEAGDGYSWVSRGFGARLATRLRGEGGGESAVYTQVALRAREQLLQGSF